MKAHCGVTQRRSIYLTLISFVVVTGLTIIPHFVLAQPNIEPPSGLVGWWAADGDASDLISGNNGTLVNGTGFSSGEVGQAFTFNGINQYVTVTNNNNLNPQGSFSIEAWIYPVASGDQAIMSKWSDDNKRCYIISLNSQNSLGFGISDSAQQWNTSFHSFYTANGSIPLNAWTHVAAVYDQSTGTRQTFINGQKMAERTDAPITVLNAPNNVCIGARFITSASATQFFNGRIDELSIYMKALSASEVLAIYAAGSGGKSKMPIRPAIVTQPQSQTANAGSKITMTVVASGSGPLHYQWQLNGTSMAGANDSLLVLPNVQPTNSGTYSVIVTNAFGSITSSNAVLAVNTFPPLIVTQPQNRTVNAGGSATFSVSASGTAPLNYQWLQDGVGLTGATNPTLSLLNVQPVNAGIYSVVVTNAYGIITSTNAVLTVNTFPPSISTQPQNRTVNAGGSASFYVTASGTAPLYYQWLLDGVGITGATNPTLSLLNVQPVNAGVYSVVVTNAYGISSSSNAVLTVNTYAPSIVTQPKSQNAQLGTNVTLSVTANGTAPMSYQWRFNGEDVGNANASSLTLTNVQFTNSGSFAVVITNLYGSATSSPASLVVYVPPRITSQPQDQMAVIGTNVVFSVTADGSEPLVYQWYFNGLRMAAQTNAILTLNGISTNQAGVYAVSVSNPYATNLSRNAALVLFDSRSRLVPPSGLVSWWAADGDATDFVGGNTGIWVGGASYATGKAGSAFNLNGANQYVVVTNNANLNPSGSFSIEAWIYPTRSADQAILSKWNDDSDHPNMRCYSFSLTSNNALVFAISDSAQQWNVSFHSFFTPNGSIPLNAWSHVAAVYNQSTGTRQIFINGQKMAERTDTPITVLNAPNNVSIGAWLMNSSSASQFFKGRIDELSFYGRALSGAEISEIYKADANGKMKPPVAPGILAQPQYQTVNSGDSVTLNVVASGSNPLFYQWLFNGISIDGATNSILNFSNIQTTNTGTYAVMITNDYGSVTSSNATLTVRPPPSILQVISGSAASGTVVVPINLIAQGGENALGFSLSYDPRLLNFASISLGEGVKEGYLNLNTNEIGNGRLGVAVSLPASASFTTGTQELARISFATTPISNTTVTPVTFGDQPIIRQVVSVQAGILAANYINGEATIPFLGYEGDVSPRPNGDKAVTIADWVQVGRFVAGLDAITNSNEFQRADCAPWSTVGDGRLTVSDWVQAGRYAAGLTPLTPVGGPMADLGPVGEQTVPSPKFRLSSPGIPQVRTLKVVSSTVQAGTACQVCVQLNSAGNENAIGFSLKFEPSVLNLTSVTLGGGATGATLNINTNHMALGEVGLALALPTGSAFPAGTRDVVNLGFVVALSGSGGANFSFTDVPVVKEIADVNATALATAYQSGVITVFSQVIDNPKLKISQSNGSVILSWPAAALDFNLEASGNLTTTNWQNFPATLETNANDIITILRASDQNTFYRLRRP